MTGTNPPRVILRDPADLKARANNPRTHSAEQVDQLKRSIERFGFTNPVLIDASDGVIAGHGRLMAAKVLGLTSVPTICLAHLSEAEARAYVIADNQLALNAGWDMEILREEILALDKEAFELDLLGFEAPELDAIIQLDDQEDGTEAPPPEPEAEAVCQVGDVLILGEHRVVCGDARDRAAVDRALGGSKAQLLLTDPPYNVPIAGNVSGSGRHREFAMASGEMSEGEFRSFLRSFLDAARPGLSENALAMIAMDWRGLYALQTAARQLGLRQINLCVWATSNGGMGSLYRSRHELFAVYAVGKKHINNVELGRHGRHRTNVWEYDGFSSFGPEREEALSMHPTVKPTALLRDAILDVTHRGDLVLDPFVGSGSTLLAAHQTGRRAACIELDPLYVDVTLRRFHRETGVCAVHEKTGRPFPGLDDEEAA
ncbi:MAG: site-specific DNA-methyltransferase [Alphaproteobacteria bacterium]|nr:site-specific DNA-methyltransferase [Alphaproteobacteria bacterium]